ncbi:diacylglycerol/lipid kinase family protein [Pseudoalteromonas sp. T1lg76]|uniref:diacylglycerol/lipid kinase family protein n=1 Tax=Pseudoalteromonas sp. T1lg76 TaxID=2077103 RepID=UPI001319EECB|nr:YegS/Rv2252/BmrU family lipid kinase [Pseudoalteromonas sp. T1lg76]
MNHQTRYLLLYHPLQAKAQLKAIRQRLHSLSYAYVEVATSGDFYADLQGLQTYIPNTKRVIALGGDGTLNLAANAFAYSEVEVALIPCGSGNDFARQWRCSEQQWIEAALTHASSAIDLGKVNERYFINIAGVGYDAAVVAASQNKRGRWAHLNYAWQGTKMLYRYAPSLLQFSTTKAQEHRLLMMCLANGRYFGGGMCLAPKANICDGQLSCVQIGAAPFWRQIQALILSYFAAHTRLKQVNITPVSQLDVHTANIGIEADGEYIGTTPALFSVQRGALNFVMPV